MLRHRIIPVVLIDGFSVLKTIHFQTRRNLGSPITVAKTYNTRNVDELILLDIDASKHQRSIDKLTIMDIAAELFMPLTVGGGIQSIEDIEAALQMGADKVSINSAALKNPAFISSAAKIFGRQCLVISIDVCRVDHEYKIYSHVTKSCLDLSPFAWALEVQQLGAGEVMINAVDQDGMMQGPDLTLIQMFKSVLKIPMICQGGVAHPDDCIRMIQGGASAVAAASIFHFTDFTPDCCKKAMHRAGLPVRISQFGVETSHE